MDQASSNQPSKVDGGRDRSRLPFFLLLGTLAAGLVLRLWGIDYGLPYEGLTYNQLTFEESKEVHRALKLGAGEYAWIFGKGGLYYILFVEYGFLFVLSWALGWVSDSREFALQILQDRTVVFLMGRVTVAILGTLTCLVVYELGKRLYDWRTGLIAAFIGATSYFHGLFSTVINVDIGMTLCLWISVLLYFCYEQQKTRKLLIAAGSLGGLAIAFKLPGIIVLPFLCLAIATTPLNWLQFRQVIKECSIFFLSLLVTLTIVAPEWTTGIAAVQHQFTALLGLSPSNAGGGTADTETIRSITVIGGNSTGYVNHLTKNYNLMLTVTSIAAVGIGLAKRQRWDLLLGFFVIFFVGVMSLADRSQAERYLLPVMPALWLLSARAISAVSTRHWSIAAAGVAIVSVVPLIGLIRHDVEKMHLDTRIVAKQWIEANVASGARFLMDGMRYRFIPSPPLSPDKLTLERQVSRASTEGESLSRGVSDLALSLYEEALSSVDGPTYELHSTTYGLKLESPEYYIEHCFDYIVTSSFITQRFGPGRPNRERFPEAARFYEGLPGDPRFELIHQVVPERWGNSGPTISIYEVVPECQS